MTLPIKCNFKISEKINEGKIRCNLCPHFCLLKDGQVGKCHARHNIAGESVHVCLGETSSVATEPLAKKPIRHYLEGTTTLTYGGFGCNLSCRFCENNCISQAENREISNNAFSPDQLVQIAKIYNCPSITMSYNEPILSYEFLIQLGKKCQENGLKFILKTNAFVNKEPWADICRVTDSMNIDWKGSEEKFKYITGASEYVLPDRIKEAYDLGIHLETSLPLYYQDDELEDEMKIVGEFLSSIDKEIPCHLLTIQPSYKYEDFVFNPDDMDRAKDILSRYMSNVYSVI